MECNYPVSIKLQSVFARPNKAGITRYTARYISVESGGILRSKALEALTRDEAIIEAREYLENSLLLSKKVKRCFSCGKYKPLVLFYKNTSRTDGFNGECKACFNVRASGDKPKKHQRETISICHVCGEIYRHDKYDFALCIRCKKILQNSRMTVLQWFSGNGIEPQPDLYRARMLLILLRQASGLQKHKGALNGKAKERG